MIAGRSAAVVRSIASSSSSSSLRRLPPSPSVHATTENNAAAVYYSPSSSASWKGMRRRRAMPLLSKRLLRGDCHQLRWRATNSGKGTKPPSTNISVSPDDGAVAHHVPKSFVIGAIAGGMGSLAGMGGGFVMIPLMTSRSILRLRQHQAHGTSLFAVASTGIAGALGYGLSLSPNEDNKGGNDVGGIVEVDTALALASCAMFTARLGASTTSKLSERTLRTALGVFMLCVAPLVPAKAYIATMHHEKEKEHPHHKEMRRWERLLPAGIIGLGSGFLAGLFGVGGGAVVVPALAVLTDMTHHEAVGTSLCAMTLPAAVGTYTHYQKGNVAMRVAPTLAVGSFVGAYLGARFGLSVEEDKLRYGFSGLMFVLGTKTLMRG